MQVEAIDTISCDAGWRNYEFLKLTTTDGIVGWAEYGEGFGSPGVTAAITALSRIVVEQPIGDTERIFQRLRSATRPATGGVVGQAIGAIENALLDAKAKSMGVPCYELLGGKVRDRVPVYWSHCGTWRAGWYGRYGNTVTDLAGIRDLGAEVRDAGFRALKTNTLLEGDGRLNSWAPGFGRPFDPALNVDRSVLRGLARQIEAFQEGAGDGVEILLDLNFNCRTEGYSRIVRELNAFDLFWIEIDSDTPDGLAHVRANSSNPISGGETLFGASSFVPYFMAGSLDVGIIDGVWNGFWQAMKMAATAEGFEINVAPHNFYGHHCTMMNAHFAAAVPNLRIMETDIDRLPWDDDLVTHPPEFVDGELIVPDRPGWGTDPIEEALRAHPPSGGRGI